VFIVPRVFKESSVEDSNAVQPVSLFRFLVAALSRAVVAAAVWGGCEGGLSVTPFLPVPSNLRRNSRLQRSSVTDSDGFGFAITLPWTLKTFRARARVWQ
jgi:hypothetical protein